MYILGINAYHAGSSACLIRDGQLVAAAEEERFNRRKYWAGFPVQAIQYVLQEAGISPYDLDHIGISRDPNANLMKKVLFTLARRPSLDLVRSRLASAGEVRDTQAIFTQALGLDAHGLRAQFHNVEHHRAHLASAFFVSPFEKAAVFSVDGMGDFVSTMWGTGDGTSLDVDDAIYFPHSLGFFYTAITQWLGFVKYGDEGKVMGLAPYGEPRYLEAMRKIVRLQRDQTFELDLDYFVIHREGVTMSWDDGDPVLGNLYSPKLVELLGDPRIPRTEITQMHMDVAASLQAMLEEAEFALVRRLQHETGMKAICMAGGVALNSAFNGKVLPQTDFEEIFIQPAAGDAGTAMGVCYYIYHQILGQPRQWVLQDAYTGPQFGNGRVEGLLQANRLSYRSLDEKSLVDHTARLIAGGEIVGWFQGRMEWGPRALGNRSILADPRRKDMKDILNARIKHREKFRPFAPSILEEAAWEYFDQTYPDPFMLKVYNVLPHKHDLIPAVTHIDGTGRLQTVSRQAAPLYWELINTFGEITGIPVVLNTSFNENEPIVCTPEEALDCFLRTRMDALVMGSYLVEKNTQAG
jgi:carbamoyltransferase